MLKDNMGKTREIEYKGEVNIVTNFDNRAQADKEQYSRWMAQRLTNVENLDLAEGMVTNLCVDHDHIAAVEVGGTGFQPVKAEPISCRALILTTGTFLNGLIHVGLDSRPGGRLDDTVTPPLPTR